MAFAGYLKQSTAVDILLGPCIDDGDGKSAEIGLTLDVELSKNGQPLADSESAPPTHDAAGDVDGYYNCILGTTDTNTLGILTVVAHAAGFLPVRLDYQIVTANWFDTMCSTENLDVNVKEVSDDSTAADNLELACDNYSATRGLTGTAVPDVAADGVGGLPISDAGGLDLDTKLANTNEITAARMGVLTDWINGGRLDLILDIIAVDTTTDIPALIATAQTDLDTITGTAGVLIATDAQDLSATLDVNAKTITNGAIAAGTIANAAIDNATFAADVGSTAYATNIIALAARKAIDDYDSPTKTEMDIAHALLATEAKQDIMDANVDQIETAVITNATGMDIAADIIAVKAETVSIQSDTDDIQSRIPAALSSGNMKTDVLAISTSTDAADKLESSAKTIILGTAQTGTLSTTEMTTNLTITVNDQFNGRIIIFKEDTTTAALRRQATDITDSVTTNGKLTFTALTTAPVNGDTFCIV